MLHFDTAQMAAITQAHFFSRVAEFIREQTSVAAYRHAAGDTALRTTVWSPHWPTLRDASEHDAALFMCFLLACATLGVDANRAAAAVRQSSQPETSMKRFLSERGLLRFSAFDVPHLTRPRRHGLTMGCFSRSTPASGKGPCVACCQADHAKDDQLSRASSARFAALDGRRGPVNGASAPTAASGSPGGRVDGDCAAQARALAPVVARFDRYRQALPSARAAADINELGDKPGDEPSSKPCLTRLPVQAERLNAALALPAGTLQDHDLRNDETGFRAALYRDEDTGRMILVPRDTQPDSLVDWQANIRNGLGIDTPQYKAMRGLTSKLAANDQVFDIAGYSKGGGLAQEGGLLSGLSAVRLFNSAGAPDEALARTGQSDFGSLVSRTQAFSSDGDFLTFMNDTADPGQNIINARFLRAELAGKRSLLAPIDIKTTNPAMRGQADAAFAGQKAAYMRELDEHIDAMQTIYDTGGTVARFPPVRAASHETIADSATWLGNTLGAGSDQPSLGKLNQHKMQGVLGAMEKDVANDRQRMSRFLEACG